MKKIVLAIDVGEVRIGVAVSDGLGMLAHPLTTLRWKSIDKLAEDLEKLLKERNAGHLVVGLPLTLKGTSSEQTKKVKELIVQLRQKLSVDITEIDERLTTRMAEIQLRQSGKKASRSRDMIDQVAAVNILQTYLDKNSQ